MTADQATQLLIMLGQLQEIGLLLCGAVFSLVVAVVWSR